MDKKKRISPKENDAEEDDSASLKEDRVSSHNSIQTDSENPNLIRLLGFTIASLYVGIMQFVEGYNIMQYFFASIIVLLFIGGSKNFVKFWSPFVFLWLSYDFIHIITNKISNPVNVKEVYDLELILTGWFTKGEVLPFIFQRYRIEHAGEPLVVIVDLITAIFYMSHLFGPIIFGILIYRNCRNHVEFKRFLFTFIGVSYAAIITFLLFPAAPPWYVWNNGGSYNFNVPTFEGSVKDPGGLVNVDQMLGFPFFQTAYASLNSNAYAAIPSIHNAYAIIISIYAIRIYKKKANFMVVYPIGMAFSSIWLNHHYLIDILWSLMYILVFYVVAQKLFVQEIKSSVDDISDWNPDKATKATH